MYQEGEGLNSGRFEKAPGNPEMVHQKDLVGQEEDYGNENEG